MSNFVGLTWFFMVCSRHSFMWLKPQGFRGGKKQKERTLGSSRNSVSPGGFQLLHRVTETQETSVNTEMTKHGHVDWLQDHVENMMVNFVNCIVAIVFQVSCWPLTVGYLQVRQALSSWSWNDIWGREELAWQNAGQDRTAPRGHWGCSQLYLSGTSLKHF